MHMDEAQIHAIVQKLKAANWDAEVLDDELSAMLRSSEIMQVLGEQLHSEDAIRRSDVELILSKIQQAWIDQAQSFLKGQASTEFERRFVSREKLLDNKTEIESAKTGVKNMKMDEVQIEYL